MTRVYSYRKMISKSIPLSVRLGAALMTSRSTRTRPNNFTCWSLPIFCIFPVKGAFTRGRFIENRILLPCNVYACFSHVYDLCSYLDLRLQWHTRKYLNIYLSWKTFMYTLYGLRKTFWNFISIIMSNNCKLKFNINRTIYIRIEKY